MSPASRRSISLRLAAFSRILLFLVFILMFLIPARPVRARLRAHEISGAPPPAPRSRPGPRLGRTYRISRLTG